MNFNPEQKNIIWPYHVAGIIGSGQNKCADSNRKMLSFNTIFPFESAHLFQPDPVYEPYNIIYRPYYIIWPYIRGLFKLYQLVHMYLQSSILPLQFNIITFPIIYGMCGHNLSRLISIYLYQIIMINYGLINRFNLGLKFSSKISI